MDSPIWLSTGLSRQIVNPPSAFVPAGTHILSVNVSDPRCDRWQLSENGEPWQDSANPVEMYHSVGAQTVAIRAVCPGFPPVFSEPANASWTVVDGTSPKTSILLVGVRSPTIRRPPSHLVRIKAIAPTTSAWTVARCTRKRRPPPTLSLRSG